MWKLSEKYVAGFLDADGSFGVKILKKNTGYFPSLYLQFSQKSSREKVLYLLQESIGGTIHHMKNGKGGVFFLTVLNIPPKQARLLLGRISKYLVVKRRYAEVILDFLSQVKLPLSEQDKDTVLEYLKIQRKIPEDRIPNYPARKWLAGYFDGDGCIACSLKKSGVSQVSARITCLGRDKVALDLIQKSFGGTILTVKKSSGEYPMLIIHLEPSKAKSFLGYFAKYSIVKRSQCYFVLGCASGGNYRDGKIVHETLSRLKAQEQRLNDLEVDVSELLKVVDFSRSPNRPSSYAIVHRKT